jgi:3-hexulose-6-phosphate synthase
MRLQLAIDSLDLGEAEALVSRVRDLVDIVEVGTPMIIRDGVAAVRCLHAVFPELTILADLKIVDGGYLEASLAFEAGARLVTVLAAAADATVREALRAAGEKAGEIMVDLIGVEDLARRASEVEALGAHYVCLHTGVDVLHGRADAASRAVGGLGRVRGVLRSARIAVAGGLTAANVSEVAALGPDIVIVGAGIARAADPGAAAAAIRAAFAAPRETRS